MKKLIELFVKRKVLAGGVGALLAAIGGLTSLKVLQPAVERAADYGAKAVALYCELPAVDRERFRAEVNERLAANPATFGAADVRVTCSSD